MRVFCSTHPFGSVNVESLEILKKNNIDLELNPYGRKIKPEELKKHLSDKHGLIAGTERLSKEILDRAPNLKIIARVGIGLDGIDFDEVKKRRILVTYTPEAVSQAVAELTVANMLNLLRSIPQIHMSMKSGKWNRIIGFEIAGKKIGIIGFGRVGQRVAKMLQGFSCEILVNDIIPFEDIRTNYNVKFCSKDEIFRRADIITLHVPQTPLTVNLIDRDILSTMKKTAYLINTSRSGIVVEDDLYSALKNYEIAGAAIDIYEIEPYIGGRLCKLDNIILTTHSGSCSQEARYLMELGAAREIVRFKRDDPPLNPVQEDIIKSERSKEVVPINAKWHEIIHKKEESRSERYKAYRRRWGRYPTYSVVGTHPLNIDIELVYSGPLYGSTASAAYLSVPDHNSSFMEINLLRKIIDEVRNTSEPIAIKLGFRGDPLYYPHLQDALKLVRDSGSVETIMTTKALIDDEEIIENIVDSEIDILNIFTDYPGPFSNIHGSKMTELSNLSQWLDKIRRNRAINNKSNPRIRVFIEMDLLQDTYVDEFASFWGHWADVVAVVDKEVDNVGSRFLDQKIKWACSRLWQRIAITHDGKIVVCNYDFKEQFVLGNIANMTITDAWNSERMNWIRSMHKGNRSNQLELCRSCSFRATEIGKLLRTA